jgi:hypothetical protein
MWSKVRRDHKFRDVLVLCTRTRLNPVLITVLRDALTRLLKNDHTSVVARTWFLYAPVTVSIAAFWVSRALDNFHPGIGSLDPERSLLCAVLWAAMAVRCASGCAAAR